ncbi:uncharacterized protein ACA1_133360 [Acanthamoeba castellanii str. Neff]|uniref:Phosphatidylethanolamine-binding protein n=1 Tax=Acanthamoeba castellanii (strain ATCC 30010 / Neff) TaxID=1257118 RepID=L8H512_ACACF|nr:uncharacterized protein ACA1_133360 [Acanthamoeba castellanii str. Neff]ELR19823.1 hypothetical protein ACA1_133360 [Acanthamoeba castellanii str. Neff]
MSGYENVLATVTPALTLQLKYGSKGVTEGQELKPSEVQHQPTVDWDADENALYTLAMVDPDAPSRDDPKDREVYVDTNVDVVVVIVGLTLWLSTGAIGCRIKEGDLLTPYQGAAPPPGSGEHRYVLVLFKQPDRIVPEKMSNDTAGRKSFKIEAWAKKNYMLPALAATHFRAQPEEGQQTSSAGK